MIRHSDCYSLVILMGEITRSETSPAAKVGRTSRILVTDDEPAVVALIDRTLRRWGYETVLAHSQLECLDVWRQLKEEISTVIMDLKLGCSDGRALAEVLRNDRPDLRVIFMSGYPAEEFHDAELVNGRNFFAKPFEIERLRGLL